MSIKPIEGSNHLFELARELKYANKQIDKLCRELAQLRKDYDQGRRAPEGLATSWCGIRDATQGDSPMSPNGIPASGRLQP